MKTKEKYVAKQLLRLGYRCVPQCRADLVATLRYQEMLHFNINTCTFPFQVI